MAAREGDAQLLEVAIGNVVTTPVRDSIELNAVGELHLVLFLEPPALLVSFRLSVGLALGRFVAGLYRRVFVKLVLVVSRVLFGVRDGFGVLATS